LVCLDKREIKVHLEQREVADWPLLDHQEKEVNEDPPDPTDHPEKTTFLEVTKSPASRRVDQEHRDPKERKETSVVTVHQDKRESRVSTDRMDQRENQVSEVHEVQPDATDPRVQVERKETKVNGDPTDRSDHKEKADRKVSQDHQDNQDPRDPKVTPVAKDPKDRRESREDAVTMEHRARRSQDKRESRGRRDQEVAREERENQERTSTLTRVPLRWPRRARLESEDQWETRDRREIPDTEGTDLLEKPEKRENVVIREIVAWMDLWDHVDHPLNLKEERESRDSLDQQDRPVARENPVTTDDQEKEVFPDHLVRLERREKWASTEETVTKDQSDQQVWQVARETWDPQVVVDLQDLLASLVLLISVSTL